MRQAVYIIYNEDTKCIADNIRNRIFINKSILIEDLKLSSKILKSMATNAMCEYFYVINPSMHFISSDFDFGFKPESWDMDYVHTWNNNSSIRLYNTDNVLAEPDRYSDIELEKGNIQLKDITSPQYIQNPFDIIFLGYDELYADINFDKLKSKFPRTKRVNGIKGILEAHLAAASIVDSQSEMFYVVDADAEVVSSFDFSYIPPIYDQQMVHLWYSQNPVNNLKYGYGGIKLFPTSLLLNYAGSAIDFTTTVSEHLKVIPEISNITRFNTDPFSTWRSAFRECTKLASKLIPNQNNEETEYRLDIWCTKGKGRPFGEFAIDGAIKGAAFGKAQKDQPDMLRLINDFDWLKEQFNS